MSTAPTPPIAPRRPTPLTAHGDTRVDDWFWLRDRDDPEVIAYLQAENAYCEAAMTHTTGLQERLFEEIRSRIQETDTSAPVRKGEYLYYARTVEGQQYAIHCRKRGSLDGPEEILLDENAMAEGHEYFSLGVFDVSPDHKILAYAIDTTGGERHVLRFRDLASGEDLPVSVDDVSYGSAWSTDNRTFFYTRVDESMRPWQIWRHVLDRPAADDVVVWQEDDDHFYLSVHLTRSEAFVIATAESAVTTEARFLRAADPTAEFAVVEPRRQDVEYHVDHQGDRFLIVVNDEGAENFRLVEAPVAAPGRANWKELIAHRPDVKLDAAQGFARHVVLHERSGGLDRLSVMRVDDGEQHVVEQPEPTYALYDEGNAEYDTDVLRFGYTSLVTPRSSIDYDLNTRTRTLVKQQPVLGGYDPARYETERLWTTAPDGVQVPMSVLRCKDAPRDGSAPCLLYGYGSYEYSVDPVFSSVRLSLVDRGFVFVIAHIRGGGEMGRPWYDDGKLLHKKNTFTDFIACAEHLVAERWTSPERMVIRGGSAGGLLMGAVTNMRPDLFRAVVAEVPFVDCLTTILDEDLPLTVIEWEEWGNPVADREVYEYMKSYSPVDNVEAKAYPRILVRAGLNDPRVSYWEPAKWVAKLRATKLDDNLLVMKTDLGAGHGGPSGRYDAWRDEAFVFSFILDSVGITE